MKHDYILTPDGKIIQCDLSGLRYIDLDEDEICHWKYIKREKLPNGKYRYYYYDAELDARKQLLDRARQNRTNASAEFVNAKNATKSAYDRLNRASKSAKQKAKDAYQKQTRRYNTADEAVRNADKDYKRRVEEYKKQKVKDIAAKTISKGIVYIANLLSGVSKKKKK